MYTLNENMKKEINNYVNNNKDSLSEVVSKKDVFDTESICLGMAAIGFIASVALGQSGSEVLSTMPIADFAVKVAQSGLFGITSSLLIDVISRGKNLNKEYKQIENSAVVRELAIENSVEPKTIRESIVSQAEIDLETEME